ncbi:MAG: hypothetical protein QOC99_1726 [Acidobacteriota bacterium]|jgi:hypothetical protein|nr:hypothetical protein [Acidobacteriota bacterium]
MSKPVIILITIGAWLVGCAYTAYHYVTSILALPDMDAYARNWGFRLLMFSIFRIPFWVVGLLVVVSMEIVMLKPSPRKLK